MGSGINFGSFGKKKTRSEIGGTKIKGVNLKNNKGKTSLPLSKVDPLEIINGGMGIVSEVTNLVRNINEQKHITLREKENTKQIKIEADKEIKALALNLEAQADEIKADLEKYKFEMNVKIKEIDTNADKQLKELENQRLSLEFAHKERMKMIDLLETTMNMYTDFYRRKVNGEEVDGADFIIHNFGTCIENMKSFMNTLNNGTGNSVQCDYTIE